MAWVVIEDVIVLASKIFGDFGSFLAVFEALVDGEAPLRVADWLLRSLWILDYWSAVQVQVLDWFLDDWLVSELISSSGSGFGLVTGYWMTGSGPSAGTQGSATQDPHIAANDSSSDFDVMEGYPMQQHPECSSQDMHALGQQPGISMFSRLKETFSRATRSKHATNEINKGGGEVDSPFTSQIDTVLSESVHVSTLATTPIGLSKLTPSETLLPDGRSLAEVQEVERYILAAREKEIKSLRKAEQRRATLAKTLMTSANPLQSPELTTLKSQPIGSHIASGSKDTSNTSILDGVFLNENWEYNLQTEKLTDLYTSYTYHVGWLDVIQATSNSTSVDEQQPLICDVIHSIVQMERQNLGINMPSMGLMRFLDTTKAKQPTISQMETPSVSPMDPSYIVSPGVSMQSETTHGSFSFPDLVQPSLGDLPTPTMNMTGGAPSTLLASTTPLHTSVAPMPIPVGVHQPYVPVATHPYVAPMPQPNPTAYVPQSHYPSPYFSGAVPASINTSYPTSAIPEPTSTSFRPSLGAVPYEDVQAHFMEFKALIWMLEKSYDVILTRKEKVFLFIGTLPLHVGCDMACMEFTNVKNMVYYLMSPVGQTSYAYLDSCLEDASYDNYDSSFSVDGDASSLCDQNTSNVCSSVSSPPCVEGRDMDSMPVFDMYDDAEGVAPIGDMIMSDMPIWDVESSQEEEPYMDNMDAFMAIKVAKVKEEVCVMESECEEVESSMWESMDASNASTHVSQDLKEVADVDDWLPRASPMCVWLPMDGPIVVDIDSSCDDASSYDMVDDMHAIILDDVFLPPSDALSRYSDELWVRGRVWDAEMDSDHVCGIVGGTKVPTVDDNDCDWGFDDPQVEMDEEMQVLVCHALSRVQKLKEALHVCVVFEVESNLESWGSHDDIDMLNNLSWINVTNMYNVEENNTAWSFDSHDMNALCWNKSMERDWLCDTKFGHCSGLAIEVLCPGFSLSMRSTEADEGNRRDPLQTMNPNLEDPTSTVIRNYERQRKRKQQEKIKLKQVQVPEIAFEEEKKKKILSEIVALFKWRNEGISTEGKQEIWNLVSHHPVVQAVAPYEADELSTNEKSHIPYKVLSQIPAHIFIAKFRDEEGDNIKTTIMPREIWTLHRRPKVASAVRAVHLEQFFRLPPWGTDYMRAHELMSSIQYDGKAMLTDSDGAKVEVLITEDIINEALQFIPGAYDLIPKTRLLTTRRLFSKSKEASLNIQT
ncbi:hypothetical protein L7F22_055503 [Adiantum nelumboides]|nr:hypothetical protein [Adiantum nelumboides]